ncbi:kinesin family member 13A [Reticulomyxa filosa]|uniref:Kinesin family member 13A n=1 Tax=Reticulomyxa filosa TaxID=46433 RepID=X6MPM1_RETFI|nr:kinesin family member 13A [Reticulomyxa filosa]|eukprot:ETO15626.1 kinesin family member 13A [Reticulomyxa filosa]
MGFNAVLFAYGQTGSGKTFSIIGNQQQTEIGMLPHMLRSALDRPGISRVSLSAVEAFGQIVTRIEFFDLLDQRNQNSDWSKKIGSTTINIDKLNQTVIQNPEDVYSIVQNVRQASHIAPTGKNPDSSRGNVVFFVSITTSSQNQQSPWIASEVMEIVHSAMTLLIQLTRKHYSAEDGKQDASTHCCRNYKSFQRTA